MKRFNFSFYDLSVYSCVGEFYDDFTDYIEIHDDKGRPIALVFKKELKSLEIINL